MKEHKFFSSLTKSFSLRLFSIFVAIIGSVLIARAGGPDLKGFSSAYISANAIGLTLLNFDLAQQALKKYKVDRSKDFVVRALLTSWFWLLLIGTATFLIVMFTGSQFKWIILGTVTLIICTQASLAVTGLSGAVYGSFGALIQQASLVAIVLALIVLHSINEHLLLLAIVISYLAPMALYLPMLLKHTNSISLVKFSEISELYKKGSYWQFGRFSLVILLRSDVIAISIFIGASTAGIYSVALSTAMLCTLIPSQISNQTLHEGYNLDPRRTQNNRLFLTFASGLLPAIVLVLIGQFLISILYGNEFSEAYPYLLVTLPGVVFYGIVQVESNLIRVHGNWIDFIVFSSAGALVMIFLLCILIPLWGGIGAAVSFTLGVTTSSIVGIFFLRKYSQVIFGKNR